MGLRINTNTSSINAQRHLGVRRREQDSSLEKLSSGQRINRASDDAAGLAISENLKAQIRSSQQAQRNAQDGVSMVQTAEGGLNEVSNILIRMRELSMQSASDNIGDQERVFLDQEYQQLKLEVGRISEVTEFNGRKLLNGSAEKLELQIGTHNTPGLDRIVYDTQKNDVRANSIGINEGSVFTKAEAQNGLSQIDLAINAVNGNRAYLGSLQNRLFSTSSNLANYEENIAAANSRIRDVDIAEETAKLTANNVMTAAATSVLTQANQSSSIALRLLE